MDNKVPDRLFFLFLSFSPLGKLSEMHEITGNNHYADLIYFNRNLPVFY
jgi:hypothetical protein